LKKKKTGEVEHKQEEKKVGGELGQKVEEIGII
jgi:hypothetical protein